MMIKRRVFTALFLVILIFSRTVVLFSQDRGAGTDYTKSPLLIVPLEVLDVPTYVPMIVERLLSTKIDSTDAYFVFDREIFDSILLKNDIVLPEKITKDIALKIGEEFEVNNVLYGSLSKENSEFVIDVKVVDVMKGEIVSESTETAKDIKDLQNAVSRLTRTIVQAVLPEEVVTEIVESLDSAEKEEKTAQVEESVSAFEKLAEEDVNQALDLVAEPVREAIKDSIREEVVQEEVQNLFEEEKANRNKKWYLLAMLGLEGSVQAGNLFGAVALEDRLNSVNYWNSYMNSFFYNDPYSDYIKSLENAQNSLNLNYLLGTGGNFGLAFLYNTMPDNLLSFTGFSRYTYAVSSMMQITGNMAQTASIQLGFYAMRKYMEYSIATTDFTAKYEAYRTAYLWPTIAEYSRTGLWTLGFTGMITAALLPGEKTPMLLTEKSRKFLVWGQAMVSLGNLASGMALNIRASAEESWINSNSPSGSLGDSDYTINYITSEVLFYTSYAVYFSGAVLTWLGLTYDGPGTDNPAADSPESNNLSFSIMPSTEGITAVVSLRLD